MTIREKSTRDRALKRAFVVVVLVALYGCAGDELAKHAINNMSEGWYTWGNVKTEALKDPTVQGGKFQRIAVPTKPAQPWDDGVVVAIVRPIKKGDVIVFAFWARAKGLPEGDDFIQLYGRVFQHDPPQASITPEDRKSVV